MQNIPSQTHVQASIDWPQAMQQQQVLRPGDSRATLQFFADTPTDRACETRKRAMAKVLHGDLSDPRFRAETQRRHNAGAGVFITVNPTDLQGRREGNTTEACLAFLDADFSKGQGENYCRFMETTGLVPALTVESSAGNFHTYFRLRNCALGEYSALQKMMWSRAGTDPLSDLARVARLAGCWHRKHAPDVPPFMSRVVEINDSAYTVAELRRIVEPLPQVARAAGARTGAGAPSQPAAACAASVGQTHATSYAATARLRALFEKHDGLVRPAVRELIEQVGAEGCGRHDAVVAIAGRIVLQRWTEQQALDFLVPLVNQRFGEGDWTAEIEAALAHARRRDGERVQRTRGVTWR